MGMSGVVCSGLVFFVFSFLLLTSLPMRANAAVTVKTATTSSSLVGWWTFDDASSTKATDFSGYGNTGTISCSGVGCIVPTFVSGKRGKALDFSSNGTYYGVVSLPSSVPVASTNRITVSTWYYNKGGGGDPRIITRNWCTAGSWLMHVTLGFGVTTSGGCAGQIFASFGAMNVGQWYLLTGVFDGTNIYSYKNGVRVSTAAAGTVDISANAVGLAMMTGNNGQLDDMRIYNRALSASEIAALYRSGQVTTKPLAKNNLVGYWPFNEGTSTKVADFSGNGNQSLLNGFSFPATASSGWTKAGKRGGALTFDGIDDYFTIAQPNIQTSPNLFTISGWINPDNQNARFIAPAANGSDNWLSYDNTNQRLEVFFTEIADVNNRARYSSIGSIPLNRWTHWAVSINDKDIKIYINGVLDSSYTETINIGGWSSGWFIGQRGTAANWFKGKLDDFRIYNKILSADEVMAVYRQNETSMNTTQTTKSTNGLVGYWTFNGSDIGTTVRDVTGNGWNGYLVGANNSTSTRKTIGKSGQAFSFGGFNTGGINVGSSTALVPSRFTVSAWVNPNTLTYQYNYILSNARDCCGTYNGIEMYFFNNNLYGGIYNSSNYRVSVGTSIATSTWGHAAFTYDGSNMRLYFNGDLVKTQAQTVDPGSQSSFPTYIGSMGNGSGSVYTFNGKLDEVRLYSRALSDSEVKQLYLMGK